MKARFVVTRTTQWSGYEGARHFLQPQVPDWDESGDQAVEAVLFDVALAAIPQDFEFCNKATDKENIASYFGEEGIEINEYRNPVILAIGDIVDIDITIVGRVSYQPKAPAGGNDDGR